MQYNDNDRSIEWQGVTIYLMILTLAADDVHLEAGVVVPGLDVEPEEPGGDGVLQVAHLHRVRVLVPAQQLQHVTVRTVRGNQVTSYRRKLILTVWVKLPDGQRLHPIKYLIRI